MERLAGFTGHQGSVYSLIHGRNRGTFISGSGDGQVVEWSIDEPDEGKLMAKVNTNIFSLLPLTGWKTLLIGQLQGGIHVIDLKDRSEKRLLTFHKRGVFDLKLVNDGKIVLAAGGDGVLSVWSIENFDLVQSIKVSDRSLRSIAVNPQNSELAIGASDGCVYILDSNDFRVLYTISHHNNSVFTVIYCHDCKTLFAGSRDAFLSVWNVEEGYTLNKSVSAHMATVNQLELCPNGRLLASVSRDKSTKLWDVDNLELLKVISNEKMEAHINSVNCLLWLDDETLITGSDDRNVIAWKVSINSH